MNENINQKGERLSFFKLFNEKKYKVQIPIIQRDYAQGRNTTKEVRTNFLNALYEYLEQKIPNRDLDFVYGSLTEENGEICFVPLDGQQRLTTLFLLHWYLCQISENNESVSKFKNALIKNNESLFTYETRSSSREFCNALINSSINIKDGLIETDYEDEEKNIPLDNELSKTIQNESWFFLSWKFDPTIQAMLTMLDDIHHKFCKVPDFFDLLIDTENPIVTFLFLNLKDFQLTDDLYIKMNSRGKALSPFENFKANFINCLDNVDVVGRKFVLDYNGIKKQVSLKEYFSYNIDTKWADTFWQYRNLQSRENRTKETDNNFDDEFVNFIRTIFMFQYAVSNGADDNLNYLIGTKEAKNRKDYMDVISYYKYRELNVILDTEKENKIKNSENFAEIHLKKLKQIFSKSALLLVDALDALTLENKKIKNYISADYKKFYNENAIFENALRLKLDSYSNRLRFFAYIKYLIVNRNNISGLNQWMRVIHNITHPDNMPIDDVDNFARAIQSIEEMSYMSIDILGYLRQHIAIKFFDSDQIIEERIKAILISKSEKWLKNILQVEKHNYFNGQIGFILDFAGILSSYSNDKNLNWNETEEQEMFKQFCNYSEKSQITFADSYENRKNDHNYCFERAVFTKGNYCLEEHSRRSNLLSTNQTKNNIKRSYSWKNLLKTISKRYLVKAVFDDERLDTKHFENSLEEICKDVTHDWRDLFIDCPQMFSYSNQGFIGFDYDNRFTLYKESRLNHYHIGVNILHLWEKYFVPNFNYNVDCYDVTTADFPSYIELSNLNNYGIRIYYEDSLYQYNIIVYKNNGVSSESKFNQEIRNILTTKYGFSWICDYYEINGFIKNIKSEKKVFDVAMQLSKILK